MAEEPSPENRTPESVSEASDTEVVRDDPSLAKCVDPSELTLRNLEKSKLEAADLDDLSYTIRECADLVDYATRGLIRELNIVTLNAWTCGCALNIAKNKLKHGQFLKWFAKEFETCEGWDTKLSLRTAQRYMKLATSNPTTEELIHSNSSLRQAYQACGILPPLLETEKPAEKGSEAAARVRLLRSVTGVRSTLQRFSQKKHALDESTRKELMDAKTDIDQLFASLLG